MRFHFAPSVLAKRFFMSSAASASKLHALDPATTCFLLCDIQERFRPLIHEFPSLVASAQTLVRNVSVLTISVVKLFDCSYLAHIFCLHSAVRLVLCGLLRVSSLHDCSGLSVPPPAAASRSQNSFFIFHLVISFVVR